MKMKILFKSIFILAFIASASAIYATRSYTAQVIQPVTDSEISTAAKIKQGIVTSNNQSVISANQSDIKNAKDAAIAFLKIAMNPELKAKTNLKGEAEVGLQSVDLYEQTKKYVVPDLKDGLPMQVIPKGTNLNKYPLFVNADSSDQTISLFMPMDDLKYSPLAWTFVWDTTQNKFVQISTYSYAGAKGE